RCGAPAERRSGRSARSRSTCSTRSASPRRRTAPGTGAAGAFRKRCAGPRAGSSGAVRGGRIRWAGHLHGRAAMTLDDASTELERRQSQADFLSLAETLSSLIGLIDGDVLAYVNPAGCEMLGRPRDWYVGRAFWEVVHPDDREGAIARSRSRQAGVPAPKR